MHGDHWQLRNPLIINDLGITLLPVLISFGTLFCKYCKDVKENNFLLKPMQDGIAHNGDGFTDCYDFDFDSDSNCQNYC